MHSIQYNISKISVYSIGVQLLDNLKIIHSTGFVYNDLKLDNVMLEFDANVPNTYVDGNIFKDTKLALIDYGFATRYIDKKKNEHIKKYEVDLFQGNLMFGSAYQLSFASTSRRDDLISLVYLLIFIINKGNLLDLNPEDLIN